MKGPSHAASGWVAGLLLGPLVGLHSLDTVAPFAVVTAGFALVPDLDHPATYASHLLGPVTELLSSGLRKVSALVYRLTRTRLDDDSAGAHRHLSHTLVFAVVMGTLAAVGTSASPLWGSVTVLALGTLLAVAALGDWMLAALVPAAGTWLAGTHDIAGTLHATAGWLGLAVGVGCFVHCLGDSLTRSGCPWLWPIPIRGKTWQVIRLPNIKFRFGGEPVVFSPRFSTGKAFETRVVFPVLAVAGVLLTPGVWPVGVAVLASVGGAT